MPGFRKFDATETRCIKDHLKKHNIVVASLHVLKKEDTSNKPCVDTTSIEQRGCEDDKKD